MVNNLMSPIVIFTYRRNIDKLIDSLLKNNLAKESELFIFSDGYKSEKDKADVLEVRENLKNITGFKKVDIKESSTNKGLATSVIEGTSSTLQKYGKVIVLEDDLVVVDNFLNYMNEALEYYKNDKKIWSISGYTPDLKCLESYNKDIYLSVRANSWGWATWSDRWEKIDWEIKDWPEFTKDIKAIEKFNLGGNDMFTMLKMQMLGKIDSWAIRWCYNQFHYNSYTVYPTKSKLCNDGFDNIGTHNSTGQERWKVDVSNKYTVFEEITIDKNIIQCFKKKYNMQLKTRIGYLLKEYGGYKFVKNILKGKYEKKS